MCISKHRNGLLYSRPAEVLKPLVEEAPIGLKHHIESGVKNFPTRISLENV